MLRMHTTDTLHLLDAATIEFGKHVRKFADITCSAFNTTELPKETAARMRRQARKDHLAATNTASNGHMAGSAEATRVGTTSSTVAVVPCSPTTTDVAVTNMRTLSLSTYKLHSVGGHYVDAIRDYGTTDSYTTQLASLYFSGKVLMLTILVG